MKHLLICSSRENLPQQEMFQRLPDRDMEITIIQLPQGAEQPSTVVFSATPLLAPISRATPGSSPTKAMGASPGTSLPASFTGRLQILSWASGAPSCFQELTKHQLNYTAGLYKYCTPQNGIKQIFLGGHRCFLWLAKTQVWKNFFSPKEK